MRGKERERKREQSGGIHERVRKRAQHVFPLSRSFRTAERGRSNVGETFVARELAHSLSRRRASRRKRARKWALIYFVSQ